MMVKKLYLIGVDLTNTHGMKRNRQLLEKNPIYSLTICKDFELISCIIIKKFNVKTYSDKIEGEDVKQLMLHFSYPHF